MTAISSWAVLAGPMISPETEYGVVARHTRDNNCNACFEVSPQRVQTCRSALYGFNGAKYLKSNNNKLIVRTDTYYNGPG